MDIEKRVEDSIAEHDLIILVENINGSGRLFGGQLVEWIDIIAGVVAKRHSQCNCTTAAIDNLQFKAAAHLNDTLVLIGRLTYVGNTSMEVRVDTYVEGMDGMRKPINRAYLVMVALDENERPTRVPRLIIETEAQRAEWEGGYKRTQLRKLRRKEGF